MVYGILRDKERLDGGEPTEILASLTRQEVAGIDKLGIALFQTLLRTEKDIDVTPADSGRSEKTGVSIMHDMTYAQSARVAQATPLHGGVAGGAVQEQD